MPFTVTFPTAGTLPAVGEIAAWLVEQGEPFDAEGPELRLRALPLRLVRLDDLQGWIEIGGDTPLPRLVDLLFALSVRAGADVRLAGASGELTRAGLWLLFADEQDRLRLADAIDQSGVHGHADEVHQGLWAVLAAIGAGRDLRWDAAKKRVVELVEVGTPGGMPTDEARWLDERAVTGDAVSRPPGGPVHVLAWRYLSQAWPSLVDE